jgi:hypothetical protein
MSRRPVRRGQAISPFGVGAMVDFPGPVSLVHCGLDAWPIDPDRVPDHREFLIEDEPRLAQRLGVRHFLLPPDHRVPRLGGGDQRNLRLTLPFARFPLWHVCPRCGLMYRAALHDATPPVCEGPVGTGAQKGAGHTRRRAVQVRFIAACAAGHLRDLPWWEWVTGAADPRTGVRLRMHAGATASLASVRIACEAPGADIRQVSTRSLAGLFTFELGGRSPLTTLGVVCRGENPALGWDDGQTELPGCGQDLYPILRGAANVYFPHVTSAIYIPPMDSLGGPDIAHLLENEELMSMYRLAGDDPPRRFVENLLARFSGARPVSLDAFIAAATKRVRGETGLPISVVASDTDEQRFRRQEYAILSSDTQDGYPTANLLTKSRPAVDYRHPVDEILEVVSQVHKLRETRAFAGFSRVFPGPLDAADERRLMSREPVTWLPAVVVRGEGIFIRVSERRLKTWLQEQEGRLGERLLAVNTTFQRLRERRHQALVSITPRFVLLHTLSHLLITQLTLECGYGSAALRERLYCSDDPDQPMAGILIYTAAGDSEGTLGGLVRMGAVGRLEPVVRAALQRAQWCSTDPVCIESRGQGPDSCNLAACHACTLLPETSCEEQNRLLDRALVMGTLDRPGLGFATPD